MNVGGLFDGCGLLAYGLHLAGLEHAWLCELDEWRQGILRQRFPGVHVYPDVRAVGADAPRVDIIAGGFPCKGISAAGPRTGFGHPESALWREMHRVIGDVRPRYVLVENVADLLVLHDGDIMGEVLGGLAALGYDAEWDCFPAAAFGAPHGRDRVFITAVADTVRDGLQGRSEARATPRATGGGGQIPTPADANFGELQAGRNGRGADSDQAWPAVAADTDIDGRPGLAGLQAGWDSVLGAERSDADRRGAIDFGDYELAVRRWEVIFGRPSPEPLIRRVDDGSARRVERSRLSALGDGVLVQAGWLVGRRILEHEAGCLSSVWAG